MNSVLQASEAMSIPVKDHETCDEANSFQKLSQNVPGLIFQFTRRVDGSYFIPVASAGIEAIYGCLPEDVRESFIAITSVLHPEDLPRVVATIEESARQLTPFSCEYRVQIPGRALQWVHTGSKPEMQPDGSVTWYGYSSDVTLRKVTDESLQKISVAVEQSPVSIVLTNASGKIQYVNPKFTEVTGYSPEDVLGQNPRILKSGEHPAEMYSRLWETLLSGETWRGEFHNRKKNGELYWEQASISPIKDADGVVTSFVAVKEDINQRKLAEQIRADLERKLVHRDRIESLGILAGGVAHDINNILMVVLGNAERALEKLGPECPEIADKIQKIQAAGEDARDVVKQILDFSRLSEDFAVTVAVSSSVGKVLEMLHGAIPHWVEVQCHDESCGAVVRIDPTKFKQLLMNLCMNAIQAMSGRERGLLRILVRRTGTSDQPTLEVAVSDDGVGIAAENLTRIFDPFFTTKNVNEGTGLGLSVVHGIVTGVGGTIEVESEIGVGTCFRMQFPQCPDPIP
jgi:PAS domain S-box-containing protein